MISVDAVKSMVQAASRNIEDGRVEFIHGDVVDLNFNPANVILSYYTMQFIHPRFRQDIFDRIFQSLEWGGCLIMFEKVRGNDARFQDIFTNAYFDFKLDNQFSCDQIINKMLSLRGVLEPFSTEGNLGYLSRAGFQDVSIVWKWCCFEGYLAIK